MERFGIWDLVFGYIGNRLRRLLRKPDIDFVTRSLAIGGNTEVPKEFTVVDLTSLPEGKSPDLVSVDLTVDCINQYCLDHRKVFAHCRVGRGRAPLISICYLIKYAGMEVYVAIRRVKRRRPFTYLNKEQLKFARDYWRYINVNA
jgi:protein-tyrosine phosphatase